MPRIKAATVVEHREQARDRLLDALEALLAVHGYDEVTLAEVAAHAGMARNTVYNYVADKHELLAGLVERDVERLMATLPRQVATAPTATEALRRFVRALLRAWAEGSSAGTDAFGAVPAAEAAAIAARQQPLSDLLASLLRSGMAAGEFRRTPVGPLAAMVHAVMASQRAPVVHGEVSVDAAARRVCDFVLAALAP